MATALSLLTIYQHTKGVSPLKLKALQALEIERMDKFASVR